MQPSIIIVVVRTVSHFSAKENPCRFVGIRDEFCRASTQWFELDQKPPAAFDPAQQSKFRRAGYLLHKSHSEEINHPFLSCTAAALGPDKKSHGCHSNSVMPVTVVMDIDDVWVHECVLRPDHTECKSKPEPSASMLNC